MKTHIPYVVHDGTRTVLRVLTRNGSAKGKVTEFELDACGVARLAAESAARLQTIVQEHAGTWIAHRNFRQQVQR